MDLHHDIPTCRQAVQSAQRDGTLVGLVPTMGALHEGHLSLIRAAKERCGFVAVTIFVNPTQFAPTEDLDTYPRTLDADLRACEAEGVDLVFAPSVETMYPPEECKTTVRVSGVTEHLCGRHRPGHFDGVATVVAKLFSILPAELAFFGEKDFQQFAVIRRMAADLNLSTEVIACPTVREADGLAMSSRNVRLTSDHRRQATSLSRALFSARGIIDNGERDTSRIISGIERTILAAGPAKIDYVKIVDAATVQPLSILDRPARICLAVRIGACRLIDNIAVDAPPAGG